jgi:hypothetical protein
MTKDDCKGCHDDFYNYHVPSGCWMFDAAKPVELCFWVHRDSPMGVRANYVEMEKPPCWRPEIGVMLKKIPDYAR